MKRVEKFRGTLFVLFKARESPKTPERVDDDV
jgi:hypothetical protein